MRDVEAGLDDHLAARDKGGEGRTQRAARSELVVGAAAERLLRAVAAQQPDDLSRGHVVLQAAQIDQSAYRRMSGSQHRHGLAGEAVALAAQHVGHAVAEAILRLAFADRPPAVRARRVRREPGAGGIDHGARAELLRPLAILIADLKGSGLTALALDLVGADAADP